MTKIMVFSMSHNWAAPMVIPCYDVRAVNISILKITEEVGESSHLNKPCPSTPKFQLTLKHPPCLKPRHGMVARFHQKLADYHTEIIATLILGLTTYCDSSRGNPSIFGAHCSL